MTFGLLHPTLLISLVVHKGFRKDDNVHNAMEIGKKKHRPLFCEVTDLSFVDRHKYVKFGHLRLMRDLE